MNYLRTIKESFPHRHTNRQRPGPREKRVAHLLHIERPLDFRAHLFEPGEKMLRSQQIAQGLIAIRRAEERLHFRGNRF